MTIAEIENTEIQGEMAYKYELSLIELEIENEQINEIEIELS